MQKYTPHTQRTPPGPEPGPGRGVYFVYEVSIFVYILECIGVFLCTHSILRCRRVKKAPLRGAFLTRSYG